MKLNLPLITGYRDTDEIMLHAVMQCVVNFVENEWMPDEPDEDENMAGIQEVYAWWLARPDRVDPGDDIAIPDTDDFSVPPELHAELVRIQSIYDAWYEEDSEMMRKAVSLRQYMWT